MNTYQFLSRNDPTEEHDSRTYSVRKPDGEVEEWPSVTSVLGVIDKPWLVNWAASMATKHIDANWPSDRIPTPEERAELLKEARNQHRWVKEEAGLIGNQAHALVEQFLKEGVCPDLAGYDERVQIGVKKYIDWWCKHDFYPVSVEIQVCHPDLRVAGTLDCVAARDDGSLVVLDLKTSNQMSSIYSLQAVAYKYCYEHMYETEVSDVYIVRVGKDNADIEIDHIPVVHHEYMKLCFIAIRQAYAWKGFEDKRRKLINEEAAARRLLARQAAKEAKLAEAGMAKGTLKRANRVRPV